MVDAKEPLRMAAREHLSRLERLLKELEAVRPEAHAGMIEAMRETLRAAGAAIARSGAERRG